MSVSTGDVDTLVAQFAKNKSMRNLMLRAIAFAGWIIAVTADPILAHELADGELERWCEVIVRNDEIQVRYSIGFNAATTSTVADLMARDAAPMDAADSAAPSDAPESSDEEVFEDNLKAYVARQVAVQIDGGLATAKTCDARRSGRHPMCWCVELTFDAPQGKSAFEMLVSDRAFPSLPGQARQAIRSKSHWDLTDANAAPLIVRAKPIVMAAEGSAVERADTQIVGRFIASPH